MSNKPKSKEPCNKVLILADSQGRSLCSYLTKVVTSSISVTSIIKPNACLGDVVKDLKNLVSTFTTKDTVIVIGGSNDYVCDKEDVILQEFEEIMKMTSHTNLIVAALPLRHHNLAECNSVDYINLGLQHLIGETPHTKALPVDDLPRHMHTKHGLHFNKLGKWKIVDMIKRTLLLMINNTVTPTPPNSNRPTISSTKNSKEACTPDCNATTSSTANATISTSDANSQDHQRLSPVQTPVSSALDSSTMNSPLFGFSTPNVTKFNKHLAMINDLEIRPTSKLGHNPIYNFAAKNLSPLSENVT